MTKEFGKRSLLKSTALKKVFGNPITGLWFCPKYQCEYGILPDQLEEQQDKFEWRRKYQTLLGNDVGPVCPTCGTLLEYEEYNEVV